MEGCIYNHLALAEWLNIIIWLFLSDDWLYEPLRYRNAMLIFDIKQNE